MQSLLDIIKKDDRKGFEKLLKADQSIFSLCYGRFPLLSVCYLFDAKKIIKTYEKAMSVTEYFVVEEQKDIYEEFRKKAKRSLALYVENDVVVTPIEMLAILGDSEKVNDLLKNNSYPLDIISRLEKIFAKTHRQKSIEVDGTIIVPKIGLNSQQKQYIKLLKTLSLIMIVVIILSSAVVGGVFYNNGSEAHPINIHNEKQLIKAFSGGNFYYTLKEDIVVTSYVEASYFGGVIDGNGKTIKFSNPLNRAVLSKNTGVIKNINIEFADTTQNIGENLGIFIKTNEGTLDNVNLSINANFTQTSSEKETVYIGGVVYENKGTINNVNFSGKIDFVGVGTGSTAFGSIAVNNNKTISNCSTSKDTKINLDTVDAGGIVVNNLSGEVKNSTNNAYIKQTTASSMWYPNLGGIAMSNSATIDNCINNGNIIAEHNGVEYVCAVYVGGIACTNLGLVSNSGNNGLLESHSTYHESNIGGVVCNNSKDINLSFNKGEFVSKSNGIVKVGGISAQNGNEGMVTRCISINKGTINTNEGKDIFLFVGGIVSYNAGLVRHSISALELTTRNKEYLRVGLVAGSFIEDNISNNHFLEDDYCKVSIGAKLQTNIFGVTEVSESSKVGSDGVKTMEELKQLKEYWL